MKISNFWLLIILLISLQVLTAVNIDQYQKRKIEQQISSIKIQTLTTTLSTVTKIYQDIKEREFKYTSPIALEKMTSAFGYREIFNAFTGGAKTGEHKGLDIVGDFQCEIYPIGLNGIVIDKWYPPDGRSRQGEPVHGGYVRIKHSDGWISAYSHLAIIYVKENDLLIDGKFYRDGELIGSENIIGRQGNTGQSDGDHLHLSIETPDGEFVDPLLYIDFKGENNESNM